MMRISGIFLFLLFFVELSAQTAPASLKALNSYADYANQSADEISSVVKSIIGYYPSIGKKNNWGSPRYVCPVQPDDYYYTESTRHTKTLGAAGFPSASRAVENLRTAAISIDQKCKALDTYHKLEDYKQDNFTQALVLIREIQSLVADYRVKQQALQAELRKTYQRITAATPDNAYRKFDRQMLEAIQAEQGLLDAWNFNLQGDVHSGWPVDKLEASIPGTDARLAVIKKNNPGLKYPASGTWEQFQGSLSSFIDVKRSGLDGYNNEAKKSDKHSNDLYLDLINFLNGTLIADYNSYLKFSERDGYFGLKAITYVPAFGIRTQVKSTGMDVGPFRDIPRQAPPVTPQKNALPKAVFQALYTYVEFINETWRQTRDMQSVLDNFTSTATHFKTLETFEKRAPMHFENKDFQVPLSYYQKTIAASAALPPAQAKALNEQTEVLLNILKEVDALAAALEVQVKEKSYERDRLGKVFEILKRQTALFSLWDIRKEILYQDVRAVYNSYPPVNVSSPWQISGKALRELADLDRDALFKARDFYAGDSSIVINTELIDQALRNVIAKEYDNMKGIQKIGRSNGLCPYTPYEDLPATSKQLSEHFKKQKPAGNTYGYNHPYHSMVYLYNEIVDDYNKFCELSTTVFHLPTIHQPELFSQKSDVPKVAVRPADQPVREPVSAQANNSKQPTTHTDAPTSLPSAVSKTVVHDTVYIEKRDTVYLTDSTGELRSMEGYATNNMVLLLDISGSMNQSEKLPLLKASVLEMLSMMRQEDRITIIGFSGKPKVLLKNTSFKDEALIRKAVNDLASSGKTDGNAALKLAYKVADENYIRGGNNRIVLATDGEFALSEETAALIGDFSEQDIFLTVFNFGGGAGSARALQELVRLGKGNYEAVSKENLQLKLIREVKAKKKKV